MCGPCSTRPDPRAPRSSRRATPDRSRCCLRPCTPSGSSALVLFNTTARYLVADDYPIGVSPEVIDAVVELVGADMGNR